MKVQRDTDVSSTKYGDLSDPFVPHTVCACDEDCIVSEASKFERYPSDIDPAKSLFSLHVAAPHTHWR